jgi:hypothetical protein
LDLPIKYDKDHPIDYNNDREGYLTKIMGTVEDPTSASYEIFYSGFPAGLNDMNGGTDDGNGNLTLNYTVTFGTESYTTLRVLKFDSSDTNTGGGGGGGGGDGNVTVVDPVKPEPPTDPDPDPGGDLEPPPTPPEIPGGLLWIVIFVLVAVGTFLYVRENETGNDED